MLLLMTALATGQVGVDYQIVAQMDRPPPILVDAEDRFYMVQGRLVHRVTNRVDKIFRLPVPRGFSVRSTDVNVNRSGVIGALVSSSFTKCDKQGNCTTTNRYARVRCEPEGDCREIDHLQYVEPPKSKNSSSGLSSAVSVDGEVGFGVSRTTCNAKNKCSTSEIWRCGNRTCSADEVAKMRESNLPKPPLARPDCSSGLLSLSVGRFVVAGQGGARSSSAKRVIEVEGSAQYTKTCAVDYRGRPHITYHDPTSETLYHAWLPRRDLAQAEVVEIDGPESGIANAMAFLPDGRTVVFGYAYRNAFNKGLRAAILDADGQPVTFFWVDRSRDGNPGWGVTAAGSSRGRILVAYQNDGKSSLAQVRLYESAQALEEGQVDEAFGWEANYRDFFVLGGAGALYPFWFVSSARPKVDEDGVAADRIFDADYDLLSSPITSARLEARIGDFSFGLTYLRSFINEQIEDGAGEVASEAFDWITGTIGWERLVFYHDVRLGVAVGRLRGRFKDNNGIAPDRIFDSDYQRYELTLLNKYRIRYGLAYQTYDFHIPIYVYAAPAGVRDYTFQESFTSDVRFHEGMFTLGYSRLDYAAKFETSVADWFLDFDVGVGFSLADLRGPTRQVAGENIDTTTAFMVTFNAEIGYMVYRRFYSMYGFGLFARAAYKAQGDFTGSTSRPDPREDDNVDDASVLARYNRFLIRHGPFIDVGLVF